MNKNPTFHFDMDDGEAFLTLSVTHFDRFVEGMIWLKRTPDSTPVDLTDSRHMSGEDLKRALAVIDRIKTLDTDFVVNIAKTGEADQKGLEFWETILDAMEINATNREEF
jgi:hypothetical protein